jgi:6-phosphogluconolactonase (cycloisomerase 2 family)
LTGYGNQGKIHPLGIAVFFLTQGRRGTPGGLVNRILSFCAGICLSIGWLLAAPLALAQTVAITPVNLAFAAQPVGTTSAAKTVTVKNTSTTTSLTITSVVASGEFADTSTCKRTLAAGASCTLSVTYTPTTVGTIDGAITIVDNAVPTTQIVNLTGKAVVPLALAPATLTFPSTAVGATSAAQTVTLTNSTVALTMGTVTASGDFKISTNTCTGTIAASKTCAIGVTFAPTITGTITGALTVADGAFGSPQIVPLSGAATGTVTNTVHFAPASLTFAAQAVGTTSASQSVILTNKGTAALKITTLSASGDFAETDTCTNKSVAAGKTCAIKVTFTPAAAGAISGAITINDGAATTPQVIALTGTASSALAFSPVSLTFTGTVGTISAAQTATLTNNSSAAVAVAKTVVSGDYKQTNTCGTSIAANSSCTFSVTFAPLAGGTVDGAVTATLTGITAPQVLSLAGTATVITGPQARYAYDVEYSAWTAGLIVAYEMNPTTGYLRTLETVQLPSDNFGVVIDPSNKFLYVPDGPQILGYSIGVNGFLQALTGSPFNLVSGSALRFAPNGKFAYTNLGDEYSLNATSGALTLIGNATTGGEPFDVAVTPASTFAYIPNFKDGTISAFSIDPTTGILTEIAGSPFSDGTTQPAALVVSPNGDFLFVANSSASISAFSIASTGALTPITGSPFAGAAAADAIGIDPAGKFLYDAGNNLAAFTISSSGALTAVAGSPYTLPGLAAGVTIDPTAKFLYTSLFNATTPDVITYSIGATGALTSIATLGIDGNQGEALAIASGTKAVAYTPKFAYVTNATDKTISEFTVNDATGALTAVAGSPISDTNGPQSVVAAPSGAFVYTANSNNSISEYTVNATTGALTKVAGSPITGFGNVGALVVDPTSTFVLILDSTKEVIDSYGINATTGALKSLTSVGTVPAYPAIALDPTGTVAVAASGSVIDTYRVNNGAMVPLVAGTVPGVSVVSFDQSSQYIFIAETNANTVLTYSLLTAKQLSSVAAGNGPTAVLAEPSGKYVYVANSGDGTVSAYSLSNATGVLKQIGTAIAAASGANALSYSNDGKYLYATDGTAGLVSIFLINANGSLTAAGSATTGTAPSSIVTTGTNQ